MVVGLLARGERPDAILFADTRGEKPETYAHLDDQVKPWLLARGCELTVVCRADFGRGTARDVSLEAECLRYQNLPSRAYGYGNCAVKWKIDPQNWWLKSWPPAIAAWSRGETITRCIGLDAGEERRVKAIVDKGFANRYPLIEWGWDRDRCILEVEQAGLPVPPKSACFYCPSSRKAEIMHLAVNHPDLFERAQQMEDRALASGTCGLRGLGRRFSWRELVESNDRSLFPERPVEGCVVCADGGLD
jgi:hypothetical protein